MANLPCHDERGCDAPCCIALTVWDPWSYSRLMRDFPDILKKNNAGSILISGARNHFVVLPERYPFELLAACGATIGSAEFIALIKRYENHARVGAEGIRCVFLNRDGRCEVYEYRPHVCQNYGVALEMPCPKNGKKKSFR
jgi:Fe-S-cluster containining protein